MKTQRPELAETSLGEEAAIGRIEKALFGGEDRLVQVGRYEVGELLGAGAFGKVYRARDPQLDRAVALKVLTIDGAGSPIEQDLLGEARVMATLAHPNIAAVHDAGVVEGSPLRVFIAMELIAGPSLRAWLATDQTAGRARLERVVEILRQAGRGLAAAHAAGIVHRDFKPENALVGRDGRTRVVDFGLARTGAARPTAAVTLTTTVTGTFAGTPAYMAPELFAGSPATTASDQFACCVTMWEALFGTRPFGGETLDELRAALEKPVVMPPRPAAGRHLVRALVRGLAIDPAVRFPSMDAFVAALEPRRSRWLTGGALAATTIVAISLGLVLWQRPAVVERAAACPAATAELAGIWDPAARQAIAAAFRGTGNPRAEQAFARTAAELDRVTAEWLGAHQAACTATEVRREQSPELLDKRMACLRDWRRRLEVVTRTLARATPAIVDQAARTLGELPTLARCADLESLATAPARPRDPEAAAKIDALYVQLADARVAFFLGDPTEALAIVERVAAEGTTLGYPPVQVDALMWRADVLLQLGRYDESRVSARGSFDLALGIRDHRSAALAASTLAFAGAYDASVAEASLEWIRTGSSLLAQLEDADEAEGKLALVEGNVHVTIGQPAIARPALERSLAAWRRIAREHPNASTTLAMLGIAELNLGLVEEAHDHLREGVRLLERDLGPDHLELGSALINLGLVLGARGEYADAARSMDRGLAIQARVYGGDHPLIAHGRLNRGVVAAGQGDFATTFRELERAHAVAVKTYGTDHVVTFLIGLASAEFRARTGAGELARAHALRNLEIVGDDDHGPRALAEIMLALAELARDDRRRALAHTRSALAHLDRATTATPSHHAIVHGTAGEILLALGHHGEAAALLQTAETELAQGPPDPYRRALLRFALARATLRTDRAAAVERARTLLAELPPDLDPALRTRLTRWLARPE